MYSCNGKPEFSAPITPVLSVTQSFRNHYNVLIFGAQETFLIILNISDYIINDENS